MSVSIKDLLRSSFRLVGSLRVGFSYSPSEFTDGLFVLNAMLDGWQADELNAPASLTQNYPLNVAKKTYTIGTPGGDFNGPRPTRILDAKYVVMTNPDQPLYEPLEVINDDEYTGISLPGTASSIPQRLLYSTSFPLGSLTLYPIPTNSADMLSITSAQFLAGNLTDENAQLVVGPGYLDAIRYNLAIRLALEWGLPIKEGIPKLAADTLGAIQALNAPTPQMDCNPAVMPIRRGSGSFNRLTGD